MKEFDWSQPQKQPIAGLAISFLNTLWEFIKRLWPLAVVLLLGKENKTNRYEYIALIFVFLTIIGAFLRYLYFRFHLENDKLVVRKGWLNKEVKIIPLEKIQTVHIEQGILHRLLNVVKLSIDTAGSQKAEATIDALQKPMAEALRNRLLEDSTASVTPEATTEKTEKVLQLNAGDLFRLSLSANHLEAFFILLSFGFGIYQNIRDIDNSLLPGSEDLPQGTLGLAITLVLLVLVITFLVSTLRIFFRFYNFRLTKTAKGYLIRSGLTQIKERMVALPKIQYVSWKANWIRKLMGLWIFEYHVMGSEEQKTAMKVEVPLTKREMAAALANRYQPIPDIANSIAIRMHFAFVLRRTLIIGVLPAIILSFAFWNLLHSYVLLFFILPLLVTVICTCIRRKFRCWAMDDVLYLRRGIFGESFYLVKWNKIQAITLRQGRYQQRKGLANLWLHTASGTIIMNYIPLEAARQIANYGLYRVER